VSARVKDGIVIFLLDAIEAHRPAKLGFGVGVLSNRRVMSVWKFGSLLLGSSGGLPPLGEARVIWAPASLKT
jgi:hypothetical protein